ncbi:S1 RNA-binding domain-containing protein [Streptomyces albidoflavus]
MTASAPDPRLESLRGRLLPGAVRTVRVVGFDGADVLVRAVDAGEGASETGRIPLHDVSMRRVEHPSELFTVGQEIEAEETGRWRGGQPHFSARACENPTLRAFLLGCAPGQVVTGTVAAVLPFGVLVRLAPDVVGLLHLSEPGGGPSATPGRLVAEGEPITVKVTEVDLERHRVRLCAVGRAAES